jgi:hypothetical protein
MMTEITRKGVKRVKRTKENTWSQRVMWNNIKHSNIMTEFALGICR